AFEKAVAAMASAARLLADDRGRLPHIGDDDAGQLFPICGRPSDDLRDTLDIAAALVGRPDLRVGPPPEEAFWLLGHPLLTAGLELSRWAPTHEGIASGALPETGFYVSRSASGEHLVIDGGPHGYRNGGHAHADALSMAMAVNAVPFLIDPGTACYTIDVE